MVYSYCRVLHKNENTPQTTHTKTWLNLKNITNWAKEARLTYDLTIPLLDIFPKELKSGTQILVNQCS